MSRQREQRPGAVALAYDGVSAPRVIAHADGELRDTMLALAQTHGVPIHRDANLTRLLSQVRLDDEIPLPLFVAVAEILAFAYRLRGTQPPARPSGRPAQAAAEESQPDTMSAPRLVDAAD